MTAPRCAQCGRFAKSVHRYRKARLCDPCIREARYQAHPWLTPYEAAKLLLVFALLFGALLCGLVMSRGLL